MVLTVCGGVAVVWWLLQATVHRRHSKHGGIEKDEGPDARGLIRRAAEGRSEAIHGADFVVHVPRELCLALSKSDSDPLKKFDEEEEEPYSYGAKLQTERTTNDETRHAA
jgi:hypothetical protein